MGDSALKTIGSFGGPPPPKTDFSGSGGFCAFFIHTDKRFMGDLINKQAFIRMPEKSASALLNAAGIPCRPAFRPGLSWSRI